MTVIALTTFIEIFDPKASGSYSNQVIYKFQNSTPDSVISANLGNMGTASYPFLSFIYQGAALKKTGDYIEAGLFLANEDSDRTGVAGANKLSMSYAAEAVKNKWSIKVYTCKMNNTFTALDGLPLVIDTWLIASMSYDASSIEVLLSSGVDAVGGNTGRYLTTSIAGSFPVTGQIFSK